MIFFNSLLKFKKLQIFIMKNDIIQQIFQSGNSMFFEEGKYDKVLVDAPCTNDRHSLLIHDNNWFSPARVKERLHLPEVQSDLLV